MAGSVIAMLAIPMAMGFSIASGLTPVQGIAASMVSSAIGALFGGSKYQVYGPTAAFIPVIHQILVSFDDGQPGGPQRALGGLALCSIASGILLCGMAILRHGSIVQRVPHSVVVGFTIGIAIAIVSTEAADVFGVRSKVRPEFLEKMMDLWTYRSEFNIYCVILAVITFGVTKIISVLMPVYVPAPIFGLGLGTLLTATVWSDKGVVRIVDKYGPIPSNVLAFTPPHLSLGLLENFTLIVYSVAGIVLVSSIESLLCSKMADRMAHNKRLPFHPNKELFGQGLVQLAVPLLNGYPCTGALARTATNIKVGAVSPLSGIAQCLMVLGLTYAFSGALGTVPMACVGGVLVYVAANMIKAEEVNEVLETHRSRPITVMIVTAVIVVTSDFLHGVLAGITLYFFWGGAAPDEPVVEHSEEHFAASPSIRNLKNYGTTDGDLPSKFSMV
jgi:SulP family sulfate permease